MKNHYSLKKHILIVMGAIYSVILILLLLLIIYTVLEYRHGLRQELTAEFKTSYEEVENKIQDLNNFVLDSFLNNTNVNVMVTEQDALSIYNAAYAFRNQCESRMRINTSMSGYYFSVKDDRYYKFRYNSNTKSDIQTRKDLNLGISSVLDITDNTSGSFFMNTLEGIHYVVYYKNGHFSLACSTELFKDGFIGKESNNRHSALLMENQNMLYYQKEYLDLFTDDAEIFCSDLRQATLETGSWQTIWSQGKRYGVYKERCGNDDFYLYGIVDVLPSDAMGGVQVILILSFVVAVAGMYFLYRFVAKFFITPLYEMTETMNDIRSGNWDARMNGNDYYEEIDVVGKTLNLLLGEIERMKINSYEEEIDKQRTLVQYLQLQLNPHFYLNCMKMLNVLVNKKEFGRMQDLIISISQHLRYILYRKEMLVTIRDELTYVKNYLELQKGLSTRSITCEYQIDEAVLDWKVPILCIQTFVENSIKYAIPSNEEELCVSIGILELKIGDDYYADICIQDNGEGYSEDILKLLNDSHTVENQVLGVGITNLKKRFALLYEKEVSYEFMNRGGAVSEMIVPRKAGSENELTDCR